MVWLVVSTNLERYKLAFLPFWLFSSAVENRWFYYCCMFMPLYYGSHFSLGKGRLHYSFTNMPLWSQGKIPCAVVVEVVTFLTEIIGGNIPSLCLARRGLANGIKVCRASSWMLFFFTSKLGALPISLRYEKKNTELTDL